MKLPKYLAAAAMLSMAAAPAVAATNPAATLSVAHAARAGTPATKQSNLLGIGIFSALIAVALVAAAIVVIADDNKSKSP